MMLKIPEESLLNNQHFDYGDSFEKEFVHKDQNLDSDQIGKLFFTSSSKWIKKLFSLRNNIVKIFGLKIPEGQNENAKDLKYEAGDQIGLFKIFHKTHNEIVIGEDDSHLNFRVSLLLDDDNLLNKKRKLTITTLVQYNNWWGKLYFFPVKPFHKIIVASKIDAIIKNLD